MRMLMIFAAALCVVAAPLRAEDGDGAGAARALTSLIESRQESVVSIKYVLKIQISMGGQTQDREQNMEVRGVVVHPTGLVVTASDFFAPRDLDSRIKTSAQDVKVLFGAEEKEYEASLVARDSNLGLAFVQILALEGRALKPVVFDEPGEISIGMRGMGISRMSRGFDCVPAVGRLTVRARVEKPRTMWAIDGDFSEIGHVVYDRAGKPLGVLALQSGSEGVDGRPESGVFILPAETVARTLARALKPGAEAIVKFKEDAAKKAAAGDGATEEKPAEKKPAEEADAEEDHDEDESMPEEPKEPEEPEDG